MPFFIDFTKVNHFFDICKKSKEIFISNYLNFQFNILKHELRNLQNRVCIYEFKYPNKKPDKGLNKLFKINNWFLNNYIRTITPYRTTYASFRPLKG